MKIAINGTYIQEQASGLGVVTQNLIGQLMDADSVSDFRVYSSANDLKTQYGNHVISVDSALNPDRGIQAHIRRLWWYQTSLRWQLKQQPTKLFYSPVNEGMLFPNIPQIITIHDLIPLKYPEVSPKWRYYYLYVLPWLLKQSQRVICVSQHTKQDLIDTYGLNPELVKVVYNGYDRHLFYPQISPEILTKYNLERYLLYVGDLRFYKNLDRCLEAFNRLPFPDCQLAIAGKKDDFFYPQLQAKVANLPAKERIVFLDYVPTADLPYLYSMAQGLVFASLYEGFGLPILEAMACGCPVLAGNATSLPEVGGDSALYVDPYDVDSIREGMELILGNENLRQDLKHKGLQRAKLFSWEQTIENLQQIFIECLSVDFR